MNHIRIPLKRKVANLNVVVKAGSDNESFNSAELYHSTPEQVEELQAQIKTLRLALLEARDQSYQMGYKEGREAALEDLRKQIEDVSTECKTMVGSLKEQIDATIYKAVKPMVKLSIRIAERIIGDQLEDAEKKKAVLIHRIGELIKKVSSTKTLKIYVNPTQMNWVSMAPELESIAFPASSDVNFIPNEDLSPGECLIETDDYIVEGDLTSQLDHIEHQLLSDLT